MKGASAGYPIHTFQLSSLFFSRDLSTWTATRTEHLITWPDTEDRLNHIPLQKKEMNDSAVRDSKYTLVIHR